MSSHIKNDFLRHALTLAISAAALLPHSAHAIPYTVSLSYSFGTNSSSDANSNTISAGFASNLNASYEDAVPFSSTSSTSIDIKFAGSSSDLTTAFDAYFKINAYLLSTPFSILNQDNNKDFTSEFARPLITGTDMVSLLQNPFSPIIGFYANTGVGFMLSEDTALIMTSMLGMLVGVDESSGTKHTTPIDFDISVTQSLSINRGLSGTWDPQFMDLHLENYLDAHFRIDLMPSEYSGGTNCGYLSTTADDGGGCLKEGREDFNLANFPLFDHSFALNPSVTRGLASFSLLIANATPVTPGNSVPTPGVLLLIAAALPGFLGACRTTLQRSRA